MTTKEKLLALLQENKGRFFSGEEIARRLSVSRTAVWKAVNSLRGDGYAIAGAQNKGYCLDAHTDILAEPGIRRYLLPEWDNLEIEVLPVAASTNALLREKAAVGAPEGTVILANQQTGGRGRLGRSFYSPPDTGIYMSILLRPAHLSPAQAVRITTMAAVAAAEAIEAVSGRKTGIKWVNDIYVNQKKACGILTEASFDLESGSIEYVVLGIGMNAYQPEGGFPPELADIAGGIFPEQQDDGKNRLAAEFLNRFLGYYRAADTAYAEKYRERSLVIGREIRVITPTLERSAVALDVDRECRLIVRYDDGTVETLSTGEISIRL